MSTQTRINQWERRATASQEQRTPVLRAASCRSLVGVAGDSRCGKSTLLNALLFSRARIHLADSRLLPSDVVACTVVPIEICRRARRKAPFAELLPTAGAPANAQRTTVKLKEVLALGRAELALRGAPLAYSRIRLHVQHPLLSASGALLDLPGFNENTHLTRLVQAELKRCTHLLLVINLPSGLTESAIAGLDGRTPAAVVATMSDCVRADRVPRRKGMSEQERNELQQQAHRDARRRTQRQLTEKCRRQFGASVRMFFVNARRALELQQESAENREEPVFDSANDADADDWTVCRAFVGQLLGGSSQQ